MIFFSFLHFLWQILSGLTGKKYKIKPQWLLKSKTQCEGHSQIFPLLLKDPRMKAWKRVWEFGKCHTDTHIQPHTHTVELMEFAFWQLSSGGTTTTKITFHLVLLLLSNYASGEKLLAETECSLEGKGEFKGTG